MNPRNPLLVARRGEHVCRVNVRAVESRDRIPAVAVDDHNASGGDGPCQFPWLGLSGGQCVGG